MKFGTLSALCLTGAFITLMAAIRTRPDEATSVHAERTAKISEALVSYFCFANTKDTTVELLAKGEIGLVEACDRMQESAMRYHPDYLDNIAFSDPAPTTQGRIARNLIGHLQNIEGNDSALSARVRVLERELDLLH